MQNNLINESKKSISVVIPCYNDDEFIEKAIDSIKNQSYPCLEIIVVDDGSNAKTKLKLRELKNKISKLITQENQGQSKARNIGIKEAKGEYILLLDSDDYFDLEFCDKAIQVFNENDSVKIVTCYVNILVKNPKENYIYKPQGGSVEKFLLNNGAPGSVMFKKSDFILTEGYDENMRLGFEDWEFYIRLLKNGGYTYVIKEPLFFYRRRNKSTTSTANKNKFQLLEYIFMKHKDLYVENYNLLVHSLLKKIKREEEEKFKVYIHLEYKIGWLILRPLRYLKRILT